MRQKINIIGEHLENVIRLAEGRKRKENNIIYSMRRTLMGIDRKLRRAVELRIK